MVRFLSLALFVAAAYAAPASPASSASLDARGVFDTTRNISSSIVVNASYANALAAIQDPPTLIKLSPLVSDVTQDTTDASVWHITDMLNILGIKIPTQYTAKFASVPDGADFDTNASGVHLTNKWRVSTNADGAVEVSEEALLETSVLLVAFVEGQIKTSHEALLQAMATLLNGKN